MGREIPTKTVDSHATAVKARSIIMEIEKSLGYDPVDRETDKLGYDIESRIPNTGKLRFIEVKGRITGAQEKSSDNHPVKKIVTNENSSVIFFPKMTLNNTRPASDSSAPRRFTYFGLAGLR